MFFDLEIDPKESAVGRFIGSVRKSLLRIAIREKELHGVTQQSVASKLGVNRSVINRILKGQANLTLRSIAEIAWALGYTAEITLKKASDIAASQPDEGVRASLPSSVASLPLSDKDVSEFLERGAVLRPYQSRANDNFAPVEVAA
jgi:transcriptional regulator with XRE-family HTH domain